MTDLIYVSIVLRGSSYVLLIQEQGQPSPKAYPISKPQLAALLSGTAWALYEDLLKCDQAQPTALSAATNAKR